HFPAPASTGGVVAQQLLVLALGIPLLFLAAQTDERDRVSAELAESGARYDMVTTAAHVFAYTYDPTSGALEVDPALGELLGIPPYEVPATMWWHRVHPDDVATLERLWADRSAVGSMSGPAGCTDFRVLDHRAQIWWFRERPAPWDLSNHEPLLTGTV